MGLRRWIQIKTQNSYEGLSLIGPTWWMLFHSAFGFFGALSSVSLVKVFTEDSRNQDKDEGNSSQYGDCWHFEYVLNIVMPLIKDLRFEVHQMVVICYWRRGSALV